MDSTRAGSSSVTAAPMQSRAQPPPDGGDRRACRRGNGFHVVVVVLLALWERLGVDRRNDPRCLTANKGGREARKVEGIDAEFSAAERVWLEEVTKRLIIRAGEKAASPTVTLPQITMATDRAGAATRSDGTPA